MPKIALISDLHLGVRKNSEILWDSQKRFLYEQFFPYLHDHNIRVINVLGDIFDRRDVINVKTMNQCYDLFNANFEFNIIVGNHDAYYNTSNDVTSIKFLKKFSNVSVYSSTVELLFFDKKVLFVPWVIDKEKFIEDVNKSESEICFGHFDINGFSMGGKVSEIGFMPEVFKKFKKVFSGHFHAQQIQMIGKTEFVYCGSPYQTDWGEVDQKKGFYVLDTDTLEYEFIENTVSAKHIKLAYGEKIDPSVLENNFVKVFVKESETADEKKLDEFTKKVSESGIASIATVIVKEDDDLDNDVEISEKGQTLLELISEYIEIQKTINNKKEIQELLELIYIESLRE